MVYLGNVMPEKSLINEFQKWTVFIANNKERESHIFNQVHFKSLVGFVCYLLQYFLPVSVAYYFLSTHNFVFGQLYIGLEVFSSTF